VYVYGPVPSRRLGSSLGVSLTTSKACSYACVYCQLGRTTRMLTTRERFFPPDEILAEIRDHLSEEKPDFVTFVGDGEPTLSTDLGRLIRECRRQWHVQVAVITNGSLLHRADVRQDLMAADVVLPSLDAGSAETFRAINRPRQDLKFDLVLNGLRRFRSEYAGQLWLETMLVKGLNDTVEELTAIRDRVAEIQPDRVYVMIPTRPPCETWVEPPSPETVLQAQQIIGGAVGVETLESGSFGLAEYADAEQAIVEIGSRHPLRREQAEKIDAAFAGDSVLPGLLATGALHEIEYRGRPYLLPARLVRGRKT